MILRDIYCPECQRMRENVFVEGQNYPDCKRCKVPMRNAITRVNADAWGGPQYHPALDIYFNSKSEYRSYLRANKLMECGDKEGGSRNEDYLNLGKRFSYKGQRGRSGKEYAETRRERTKTP